VPGKRLTVWLGGIALVVSTIAAPAVYRARTATYGAPLANGALVASLRAEPRSFNRYVARDLSTAVLTLLLHDTLVRVNRATNELEPALADRWELLADGRTYRLHLRSVRFSDGVPFTAEDVVFSLRAILDPSVDSVLAQSLRIRDQAPIVSADSDFIVTIQFPAPFGPGLRMLDGIPMYPRHRLEPALAAGMFRRAWGMSTPPSAIAGLGPFVLERYEPGQRLTLARNPFYWRSAGQRSGLAHLVLEIVPDQDAELLQLESGNIDFTQSELRPLDVAALRRASHGAVVVTDAGVGLDGDLLWLNLAPSRARDPRSRWLQHRDFRQAIAHSVDRQRFIDTVYFGAATAADSIVSPGNQEWHVTAPAPGYDVERAKQLLTELLLEPRAAGGMRQDAAGRDVRFTLITQKGNTSLERGAAMIRESLAAIGVHVDIVPLEVGALVDTVTRGDYDAAYFRLLTTDTDPAMNVDFWLSSGNAHVWNPGQAVPATPWEAEVDRLMDRVSASLDPARRRASFNTVQQILARELPVLCFAFPNVAVATSWRVANARPAAFRPPVLWNAGELDVARTH
jgi:peptide/nickel transport system substrate-binding protein